MRGSWLVQCLLATFTLLGLVALGISAAEPVCQCFESDIAGRVSGEFDGLSGSVKLVGAMGLPEFSLAAWMDIDVLPTPTSTFGGRLALTRDWLSIGLIAQQNEDSTTVRLEGQAHPSSWLLYDGSPALIGGISASVETDLFGNPGQSSVTAFPFFTAVITAGDTTVSPSVGIDVSLGSEAQAPEISASRLVSTVNAGCVLIENTVHFKGVFSGFSSLVLSVTIPEWGLTVSGSLIPTWTGGFSYRVGISYEWGDSYLLPNQTEKAESVCTGGVCF